MLDRVLELVRRDVDREADAVPAELLDLAHTVIQAEGGFLSAKQESAERIPAARIPAYGGAHP